MTHVTSDVGLRGSAAPVLALPQGALVRHHAPLRKPRVAVFALRCVLSPVTPDNNVRIPRVLSRRVRELTGTLILIGAWCAAAGVPAPPCRCLVRRTAVACPRAAIACLTPLSSLARVHSCRRHVPRRVPAATCCSPVAMHPAPSPLPTVAPDSHRVWRTTCRRYAPSGHGILRAAFATLLAPPPLRASRRRHAPCAAMHRHAPSSPCRTTPPHTSHLCLSLQFSIAISHITTPCRGPCPAPPFTYKPNGGILAPPRRHALPPCCKALSRRRHAPQWCCLAPLCHRISPSGAALRLVALCHARTRLCCRHARLRHRLVPQGRRLLAVHCPCSSSCASSLTVACPLSRRWF
ncbi:hypothetical protein DENSPDRAFT_886236 [Dentipellis sp. KUC8613]|nr:hypothetical protein DENSPDRAFT_886236 [Dentipellis sp. KUC8613]